jgi:hypothetical protein
MWSYLPASALTGTNTNICNHGGYCTRTLQHRGMHTATPNPGTHAWDHEHNVNQALALLDFPTPHWADLNDEDPHAQ